MTPEPDDRIRNADDLKKALSDMGLPDIPVFDLTDSEIPRSEEMKRLIEAIRNCGDGTAQ